MYILKFEEQFQILRESYEVKNLIKLNTEVLFILESPHIDELFFGSPVSGLSGKAMSKALLGNEEKTPIGRLVKKHFSEGNYPSLEKVGIVNICPIPMQRTAYVNDKIVDIYGELNLDEYEDFFGALEKIRVGTKEKYRDEKRNEIQRIVLESLNEVMSSLHEKNLTIVPCGKTAQTFFNLSSVSSPNWTIIENVPHPSYGNWSKSKYAEEINLIKSLV